MLELCTHRNDDYCSLEDLYFSLNDDECMLFDSLFWILQAFEFELRREYTEHYLCKQV
jgi:hypothetical protein